MSDYKQLTFLRTNMEDNQDKCPAQICTVDDTGKLHVQPVTGAALVNLARDAMRILAETKFFEKGLEDDNQA